MKKLLLLQFFLLLFTLIAGAQTFKVEGNQLIVVKTVVFNTGTAVLKDESEETLKYVKEFLDKKDYVSLLRVEAHTSAGGDENANQLLSEKRAMAVSRWLVSNGVDCKRLIAAGFGSTKPIADNSTPEGKAQNIRIVFALAALRGRAIGGMPADGGGKVAGEVCQ